MSRIDELIAARSALESAMQSGARKVKVGDHEVEYDTFDAMRQRIEAINAELGDRPRRLSVIRPVTSKGL